MTYSQAGSQMGDNPGFNPSPSPMMPQAMPHWGGAGGMGMMPPYGWGGSVHGGMAPSMYGVPSQPYGAGSGFHPQQPGSSIYAQNQQQHERAQVMQDYAGGAARPPSHASRSPQPKGTPPNGHPGSGQGTREPSRSSTPRSTSHHQQT